MWANKKQTKDTQH